MSAGGVERGTALLEANRPQQALTEIHRSLRTEAESARHWHIAAIAHLHLGHNAEALRAVDSILRLDPTSAMAHVLACHALQALGRNPEAYAAANEAVRLAPDNPLTHREVATAAIELAEQQPALRPIAWQAAVHAVELDPDDADLHAVAGLVAMSNQHRRVARQAFLEALRRDPGNHMAHHNLAVLALGRGRLAAATRGLSTAGRLDPQSPSQDRALDYLFRRWLLRMQLLLFLVTLVAGPLDSMRDRLLWPLAGLLVVACAVIAGWTWHTFRSLGRRAGPTVRRVLRSAPFTAVRFGAVVLALGSFAVRCLGPTWEIRQIGIAAILIGLILSVAAGWAALIALTRRPPG